jgi:uncharacterized protein YaiE (UPF0345 family)
MKAHMTLYYPGDPRRIEVQKPAGAWMQFDAFLLSLGFRRVRSPAGMVVPGKFEFLTGSPEALDIVAEVVRQGGGYLTSGNLEWAFSV